MQPVHATHDFDSTVHLNQLSTNSDITLKNVFLFLSLTAFYNMVKNRLNLITSLLETT